MVNFLSLPYPRENSFRKQLFNAVISGLIVAVFLRVFSPFGFGEAPVRNLYLFAAGYGIVTSSIIVLVALFERSFPKIFSEEKWTVGKNVLLYLIVIFLIGTANVFYTVSFAGMPLSFVSFLNFQFFTLSVTFIVVSAMTMIKYFRSLDLNKKDAIMIDEEIRTLNHSSPGTMISLKSENERDGINFTFDSLLYIQSADNYCRVFYQKDNKVVSEMLRSSLKRFEDQLKFPEVFRCHRTYLVQLRNIEKVSGNSQGYRLHFKDHNETVPVSRNSGAELHERLKKLQTLVVS